MENYVEKNVYTEHCRMCDERFRRDKQDIEKHDETLQKITQLTSEIALLVKKNDGILEKHEVRIENLEKKPSMWVDKIISTAVATIVAAVVSFFISSIF